MKIKPSSKITQHPPQNNHENVNDTVIYHSALVPRSKKFVQTLIILTVIPDTKVSSDLLNVRAVQKHSLTQPHVTFGVHGITLNGQTSIRPMISFSDFSDVEKGVEFFMSISQKF